MKNWRWTDDELMMNWWSQTTTDCNWLIGSTPLNTQTYLRMYTTYYILYIYIPDSTYYKSTASGANNSHLKSREVAWIFIPPYILSRAAQNRLLVKFVSQNIFLFQVDLVSASRNISSLRWRGSMMRRALPCWTTSMLTARSVALASPHHHHHYNCHCHYYRCYHDCHLCHLCNV